jgi:transcription-repair coupling factor (superfamily II helicase)
LYRRLAEAKDFDMLKGVLGDLQSAYGELPTTAKWLVQYHELRIAATNMNVESIMVEEGDVVIRTRDPETLRRALKSVDATVREVGQRLSTGAIAIYVRPANGVSDPEMLLVLLRNALVESQLN